MFFILEETTDSCWLSPDEAVKRFEDGDILLPHTTWYNLKYLIDDKIHSIDQLKTFLEALPENRNSFIPIRPLLSLHKKPNSEEKSSSDKQQRTSEIKIVRLPGK